MEIAGVVGTTGEEYTTGEDTGADVDAYDGPLLPRAAMDVMINSNIVLIYTVVLFYLAVVVLIHDLVSSGCCCYCCCSCL